MAAYRLVASFMNESATALVDRQKGLLAFLYSSDFGSESTGWIARISRSLPTGSNVPNLANKLNVLYDNKPQRHFSENDIQESYFQDLYEEMNINGFMQTVSEYTWGFDVVAVGVYRSGEDLIVYKLTPDNFRVTVDPQTPNVITSLMYVHIDNINQNRESHTWTATEHIIEVADLSAVSSRAQTTTEINTLGRIPFAFSVRKGQSASIFSGGKLDIVYSQLNANLTALLSRNDEIYQSAPILLTKNFKNQTIDRRPGAFQNIDHNEDTEVSAEFIRPDLVFDELTAQYNEKIRRQELSAGIPPSQATFDRVVVESGIAKQIDNEPLNETRKKEIPYYEIFEHELYQLLADSTDEYPKTDTSEFTIRFDEPELVQEPGVSYEYDKQLLRDGMIDITTFAQKHGTGFKNIKDGETTQLILERQAEIKPLAPIEEEEETNTSDESDEN
jgi:hypothetical protein